MKKFLLCFLFFFVLSELTFAQSPDTNDLPILAVVSPKNNEQIFGPKITVSFIVKNFIFTDFNIRVKNQKGEGHLNVWLDQQNPKPENAQKIIRATEFTLENIKPGNHQLVLELVNNDQTSLKPLLRETVSFTTLAREEIPTITIEIKKDQEEQKMKKIQKLTSLSSLLSISLVTISLITVLGFIVLRAKNR